MKPEVRIIFLTCHEDFHYAQQAVKLQADDYLIKDQLTAEQLEQSLGKSMHLLKTRAGLINREALSYNSQLFRQDFFAKGDQWLSVRGHFGLCGADRHFLDVSMVYAGAGQHSVLQL